MIVRLASSEDEEKLSRLIAQFRIELKQLKGINLDINIKQARQELAEYMEAKFPIFVAENNNKRLLGYLICRIDEDIVWAESLFTSYDSRRKGIGSKLYEKAEEMAKKLGGDTVYNWVHPNNDKIIPFLIKRGYNVLNLIEIRKKSENESLTQKINVGKYKYNY